MNVSGPTILSASSDIGDVSFNANTGELLGYGPEGQDLSATCIIDNYGDLCPLDSPAELLSVGFSESHLGYSLELQNVVLLDNQDSPQDLVISGLSAVSVQACDDADNDTVCASIDLCDNDSNKTEPGQCGCGYLETDTDADGTADCNDAFPNDSTEIADNDGDGVGNNADVFPDDSTETLDNDGDGTGDNADACDNDELKTAEGECGCGVADTDCAYLTLGDVVDMGQTCETTCVSTYSISNLQCTGYDNTDWYEESQCTSNGLGLEVKYYAGQSLTGFQFNISNLDITGTMGGAASDMATFVNANGNVAGILDVENNGAGTVASGHGVLTHVLFSDASDISSTLSMDSQSALAGPADATGDIFGFSSPSNKSQASGDVSHCGENNISNSSQYWTSASCSADCAGSFYGNNLEDQCTVCDTDTTNDCTADCAGDFGGVDNTKDTGDEAYEDHCGTCDADPTNDCVLLTLSSKAISNKLFPRLSVLVSVPQN